MDGLLQAGVPTVFALLGGVCLLLALVGDISVGGNQLKPSGRERLAASIVAVALLVGSAVFYLYVNRPLPPLPPSEPIRISEAERGEEIESRAETEQEQPTSEPTATPTALPPSPPSGLEPAPVSESEIQLHWQDNSDDESGFRLERSEDNESWETIQEVEPNKTGYYDSDLECGTTYYYRVRALGVQGLESEAFGPIAGPTESCSWLYVVREGDTLPSLAQFFLRQKRGSFDIYRKNESVIGTWQPDEDFPPIFKGQVLLIPDLTEELEHIIPEVEPDDIRGTLSWAVTLHYGEQYGSEMVIDALCAYNELPSCVSLYPHQILKIPRLRSLLPDMAHILEPDYHFIRPRDTLEGIALAYYGLPGECRDIYEVPENRELIGENLLDLPVGVLLFLPEHPPTTPHVVEPDDTLSSIADQVCYGDPGRWPHIQFVNRKVLGDDVEQLRPGQRLTLYGCRP